MEYRFVVAAIFGGTGLVTLLMVCVYFFCFCLREEPPPPPPFEDQHVSNHIPSGAILGGPNGVPPPPPTHATPRTVPANNDRRSDEPRSSCVAARASRPSQRTSLTRGSLSAGYRKLKNMMHMSRSSMSSEETASSRSRGTSSSDEEPDDPSPLLRHEAPKLDAAIEEVVRTEGDYVLALKTLVSGYVPKLSEFLDMDERLAIFGNAQTILGVHVELLERLTQARQAQTLRKEISGVSVRLSRSLAPRLLAPRPRCQLRSSSPTAAVISSLGMLSTHQLTPGDHPGRSPREITPGDHTGRSHREITPGDHTSSPRDNAHLLAASPLPPACELAGRVSGGAAVSEALRVVLCKLLLGARDARAAAHRQEAFGRGDRPCGAGICQSSAGRG